MKVVVKNCKGIITGTEFLPNKFSYYLRVDLDPRWVPYDIGTGSSGSFTSGVTERVWYFEKNEDTAEVILIAETPEDEKILEGRVLTQRAKNEHFFYLVPKESFEVI